MQIAPTAIASALILKAPNSWLPTSQCAVPTAALDVEVALAVLLLLGDVEEDFEEEEDEDDAGGEVKERDTLVEAMSQNCCERLSEEFSSDGHWPDMQSTKPLVNLVLPFLIS